jgi:hypothetical protein
LRSCLDMSRAPKELEFDEPYGGLLEGVLGFRTLADAEATLIRLEQLRLFFRESDDKKGVECCRRVALVGRKRAEGIARNRKVAEVNRIRKAEAAEWFRIWLEMPEAFATWLSLRKATAEYRRLAGEEPPASPPE